MNPSVDLDASQLPTYEPDSGTTYTLRVVAELTGVSSTMILHYQEHGLVVPVSDARADDPRFDDQALRALRRIDYLRSACGVNVSGLKLLLGLMDEVDRLRAELRHRHRAAD